MNRTKGIIAVVIAYFVWGILPAYWKLLQAVPADRILAHRIVWSFAFLLLAVPIFKKTAILRKLRQQKKEIMQLGLAAILVTVNWLTYIYSVNSGQILASSLGYYINPLFSIALGAIFFRERFKSIQILAIGLAVAGVAVITVYFGRLPWISLVLAFTFGIYGLLKKKIQIDAAVGLVVETGVIFLPALAYLMFTPPAGLVKSETITVPAFLAAGSPLLWFLLPFSGLVTAIPLLLFTYSAQNLDLSLVGFLQYLAPTLMLLLGVVVYGEPFTYAHAICFGLIWLGLSIYTISKLRPGSKARKKICNAYPDD